MINQIAQSIGGQQILVELYQGNQGFTLGDFISPLDKPNRSINASIQEKEELPASFFASRMKVPNHEKPSATLLPFQPPIVHDSARGHEGSGRGRATYQVVPNMLIGKQMAKTMETCQYNYT